MKNVFKMVKNKLIVIGTLLLSLPTKVFAMDDYMRISPMYGIEEPKTVINSVWSSIWNICKFFIIPIALLVGIIIYFKKSKSSTKKKIFVLAITIICTIIIILIINNLMNNII